MAKKKLALQQKSLDGVFNEDQINALSRTSTRGMAWSTQTIKKALRLRFSCGTSGYNELIRSNIPLPSISTLQRRIKQIGFAPGIISSVFAYLKSKVGHNKYRHFYWSWRR